MLISSPDAPMINAEYEVTSQYRKGYLLCGRNGASHEYGLDQLTSGWNRIVDSHTNKPMPPISANIKDSPHSTAGIRSDHKSTTGMPPKRANIRTIVQNDPIIYYQK